GVTTIGIESESSVGSDLLHDGGSGIADREGGLGTDSGDRRQLLLRGGVNPTDGFVSGLFQNTESKTLPQRPAQLCYRHPLELCPDLLAIEHRDLLSYRCLELRSGAPKPAAHQRNGVNPVQNLPGVLTDLLLIGEGWLCCHHFPRSSK